MSGIVIDGLLQVEDISSGGPGVVADQGAPNTDANAWPVKVIPKVLTAEAPDSVSVGIASGLLKATNASRRGLKVKNISNFTVSLGLGTAAILNKGITLKPNDEWNMDEFSFVTVAINAIASGASATVSIQEFSV
jgi:hypothetical protein